VAEPIVRCGPGPRRRVVWVAGFACLARALSLLHADVAAPAGTGAALDRKRAAVRSLDAAADRSKQHGAADAIRRRRNDRARGRVEWTLLRDHLRRGRGAATEQR